MTHPIAPHRGLLIVGLLLLPGWLSCQPASPGPSLPKGPLVAGDARAFERILDSLEQLESSPIAREAARARAAVQGCNQFLASARDGERLFEASACVDGRELDPSLERLREDAALLFVWPLGDTARISSVRRDRGEDPARLIGRIHVEPSGSLRVEARLEALPGALWSLLLLPDDEPAGAPRLATRDALVQGRFRPRGGLELASLIDPGSQADLMFRLKSELFVGAALGDAWEFAIYMPRSGAAMPPMAIALDVDSASLAREAVRAFVTEIEATWPLHSRAAQWNSRVRGACFHELRIMPEFAPCYAITERSLVFAWNATSIELAISESGAVADDRPSGLVAYLDRFAEADARLQHASTREDHGAASATLAAASLPAVSSPSPFETGPAVYPFSKLELEARAVDGSIALVVRLQRAEAQ